MITKPTALGSLQLVVLLLSAATTAATWLAFMLKVPALRWSAEPHQRQPDESHRAQCRGQRDVDESLTTGGMLLYLNAQWIWVHPWSDLRAISWILSASLVSGPIVAALVLAASTVRGLQVRPSAPK